MKSRVLRYLIAIPILLILIGAGLNQLVLVANGGKFPVLLSEREQITWRVAAAEAKCVKKVHLGLFDEEQPICRAPDFNDQFLDDIHSVMGKNSRLKFLADWIKLGREIDSPGDLMIQFGTFLWPLTWPVWIAFLFLRAGEKSRHRYENGE